MSEFDRIIDMQAALNAENARHLEDGVMQPQDWEAAALRISALAFTLAELVEEEGQTETAKTLREGVRYEITAARYGAGSRRRHIDVDECEGCENGKTVRYCPIHGLHGTDPR